MKASLCLTVVVLLAAAPALHAQQTLAHASSAAPPPASALPKQGSALPPPGLNDPGAVPLPATGIPTSLAPAARQQATGHGDSTNVTAPTDANGDTIEETSRGGHATSVRVTPRHGVTQTYKTNNSDGSLVHDPRTGPVAPVYYDVYQWGKPKKPASSGEPASAQSGGG